MISPYLWSEYLRMITRYSFHNDPTARRFFDALAPSVRPGVYGVRRWPEVLPETDRLFAGRFDEAVAAALAAVHPEPPR